MVVITENIDVNLLRDQRNFLLELIDQGETNDPKNHLDGLVNLIDHVMDQAEGF